MTAPAVSDFVCALCRATVATPEILAARDLYLGHPGTFDYVRCAACRLVQQHPMPDDPTAFYAAYPVHGRRGRTFDVIRRLMMPDVYYRPPRDARPGLLLDYGCGNGDYLRGVRGRVATAAGYEADAELAERLTQAEGLNVYGHRDALHRDLAGRVDVMTLHCVLEHLKSPGEALAEASLLLKPGGLLYAVLPHFDCRERRVFGRRWHALDAPRHLTFPDAHHLAVAAAGHDLELERVKDVCFPNNLAGSVSTAVVGRFSWPLTVALLPAAWAVRRVRPRGTRAYWLRRT